MSVILQNTDSVLIIGEADLIACATVCLLNAGHKVTVCTPDAHNFKNILDSYSEGNGASYSKSPRLAVTAILQLQPECKLVIAVTHEDAAAKQQLLERLKPVLPHDAIVAINTESIDIKTLQQWVSSPARLVGLNWAEPCHTTMFLEIISPDDEQEAAKQLHQLAKSSWGKDPYQVKNEGIRGRLVSAMAREASFLVDNGYASVEDIDRACRNDAGYYLPFCGNLRYMDLMGTYAYGMVMKDLNPDLSTETQLPQFIKEILQDGGEGMKNNKGFYTYSSDEVSGWRKIMNKFSYQIRSIIKRYPFNYIAKP